MSSQEGSSGAAGSKAEAGGPPRASDASSAVSEEESRERLSSFRHGKKLPEGDASRAPPAYAVPERIRRAETVLHCRTDRIMLVLEQATDEQNEQACLRTAESLGIHRVALVRSLMRENKPRPGVKHKISMSSQYWLDICEYDTPAECAKSLKAQGYEVWVTDLSPESEMLASPAEYAHYLAMRERASEAFPEDDRGETAAEGSAAMESGDGAAAASGAGKTSSSSSSSASSSSSSAAGASDGALPPSLPPAAGTGAEAARVMQSAARAVGALPHRVAIVMGRESDGISEAMKALADKRVFLPMWGFTESLNLSVATALVLDRLLGMLGPGRFSLPDEMHRDSRRSWLPTIAKSPAMLPVYASVVAKAEEQPGYIRPIGELRRFATSRQKQYLPRGRIARRMAADIIMGRHPEATPEDIEKARPAAEKVIARGKHFQGIKTNSFRKRFIKEGRGDPLRAYSEEELIEEAMAGAEDGVEELVAAVGGDGASSSEQAAGGGGGSSSGTAASVPKEPTTEGAGGIASGEEGPPLKRPRT